MTQGREPPLGGAPPRPKGNGESMDASWVDVLGSIGERLGELLRTADQVQAEGRLKESSLHGRPPGETNPLSSKVDRLLALDDGLQRSTAHLLDADLSRTGHIDSA